MRLKLVFHVEKCRATRSEPVEIIILDLTADDVAGLREVQGLKAELDKLQPTDPGYLDAFEAWNERASPKARATFEAMGIVVARAVFQQLADFFTPKAGA